MFLQMNVVRCMLFACYLLMRSTDARIDLNVRSRNVHYYNHLFLILMIVL